MSYAWQHNNIGGGDGGGRGFDDAEDDAKDLLQPAAASSKGKGKAGKDVGSNEKLFRVNEYLQVNARTKAMTLQEIGGKLQLDLVTRWGPAAATCAPSPHASSATPRHSPTPRTTHAPSRPPRLRRA